MGRAGCEVVGGEAASFPGSNRGSSEDPQEELLEEYRTDEPGGEGFVHEELAELLHMSGDLEAARPHFAAAHQMLSEYDWVEPERLARLRDLSGS